MPASSATKLLDANVWLALAFSNHIHHARAVSWFNLQTPDSCGFCRVSQMALLRHLTNAKIMGDSVQNQIQAWQAFDTFMNDPRVIYCEEPHGFESTFRHLTNQSTPSHALWTDGYFAAFAGHAGLTLVTFDNGLRRFTQVQIELLG
jgi:uncharacterized protein